MDKWHLELKKFNYFFFLRASNLRVKSSKSMSSSSSLFFFSSRDPVAEWVGVSLGTVGNSGRSKLDAPPEVGKS